MEHSSKKKSKQERIITYVSYLTRGMVKLNDFQANRIVEIALEDDPEMVEVEFFKYDSQLNIYQFKRSFKIYSEDAKDVMKKLEKTNQLKGFFRYDIKSLGYSIETVNPNLFRLHEK